jgi:hypothetical protein
VIVGRDCKPAHFRGISELGVIEMKKKLVRVAVLFVLMFLVFFGIGVYQGYQKSMAKHRTMQVRFERVLQTGDR